MPIKPENKSRYPPNWKQISEEIRFKRAENKCENCGVKNYSIGYWVEDVFYTVEEIMEQLEESGIDLLEDIPHTKNPIKIVLTVAHLDHTPENCAPDNLRAWCQRCHNRYDRPHRNETKTANQLKLFK